MTITDNDTAILDALDFDIMCEASYHEAMNLVPEKAVYFVKLQCRKCLAKGYGYLGERCWDIAMSKERLKCVMCGFRDAPKNWLTIIATL